LVDVTVPPQESDKQLLQFLETIGRPYLMLGTKTDRLSGNRLHQALRNFGQEFPRVKILPYSARTGAGRDELWREIRHAALVPPSPSVHPVSG
jgi:GTP-binding protein